MYLNVTNKINLVILTVVEGSKFSDSALLNLNVEFSSDDEKFPW